MRVLRPGKSPDAAPRYRVACPQCEALLEYGDEDLTPIPGAIPDHRGFVRCPECRFPIRSHETHRVGRDRRGERGKIATPGGAT